MHPQKISNVVVLCIATMLGACYNPDLSRVHYTCDETNPYCPDGLKCLGGCCGGPPCVQDRAMDGSVISPSDGDMSGPSCVDIGFSAGHVSACPGLFGGAYPVASVQCSTRLPGSMPCTNASGVDLTKVNKLTGFFVANQGLTVFEGTPRDNNCTPTQNSAAIDFGWFGLGTANAIRTAQTPCSGFSRYESNSVSAYGKSSDLPPGPGMTMRLDNLSSYNGTDGVLCCR